MASVKIQKKSTDTDMTPFVDIAFLILTFFIMATKFKPQEPVEAQIPSSVSSEELPENDAVMVLIDSTNRVFFSVLSEKDKTVPDQIITKVNELRSLNLTPAEIQNFRKTTAVGVPFSKLGALLDTDPMEQNAGAGQPGIPVLDSTDNQLQTWIRAAKEVYAGMGKGLKYLVKGDGAAKYPTIEAVISAFKKNDQMKFNLVTSLETAPPGSALDLLNRRLPVTDAK
ncbi:MAG: biopolymer transporter ExbD [Bacteroidetes bacterium]|nr:biopolymer transporter ExbD [Bacteroidota bacterium]